jgi:PII-like signaling protein
MHGFKGERVLMRVHIGSHDACDGKPLYERIVELLRQRHYAGATVLRGIIGFGASSHIHSDRFLQLSTDAPLVVECVETEERIEAILPELDAMIGGGLITLELAKVIMYRPELPRERLTPSTAIDVTGSWQVRRSTPSEGAPPGDDAR